MLILPKWLQKRYDALLKEFGESEFRFNDAAELLSQKFSEELSHVNVILSELRKAGYLEVKFDPTDARKKIYKLVSTKEIISKNLKVEDKKLSRGDLESILKSAADIIRTRVDYTFILVLLFYKRICDKWKFEYKIAYQEAIEDGFSEEEARVEAKNSVYHDFDLNEELLWENIRKDPARLPENLSKTMRKIAEKNPELKDIFENIDFLQFTTNTENIEILRQLVEIFSSKSLKNVPPDVLGDAYEWLIRYFAPQKAKEGEVYTPKEIIKLMVEIVDPKPGESVYDPACGSGGMLINSYKHIEEKNGRDAADKLLLFGQEYNSKTLALAKMNLYIHDIRNGHLFLGDTLLYPKIKDGGKPKKFDTVIANPPWNQDGYPEEVVKKGEFYKERFPFGFANKQSADWLWIQHMIYSSKEDTGRIGIVIDNGCLFRGGKEKYIRSKVVDNDLIEALILLPEKLFYNTGAPGAIIILNRNKPDSRKGKILFINASNEYEQHPDIRKLNHLSEKNIEKIVQAYREFKDTEGFSRVVGIDEIKKDNDYNLNVTLYVFPEEKTEEIDITKEWMELKNLENEIAENEKKIENYLSELGLYILNNRN